MLDLQRSKKKLEEVLLDPRKENEKEDELDQLEVSIPSHNGIFPATDSGRQDLRRLI